MALPRPLSISRPEWPPLRPVTVTQRRRRRPPAPRRTSTVQRADGVAAAGAADVERALLLGVEVHQRAARRRSRRLEVRRAGEAGLLVDREEELERPVDQGLVLHDREVRRHRDAVVGAERGAVRHHEVRPSGPARSGPSGSRGPCPCSSRRPCRGGPAGRCSGPSRCPGEAGFLTTTLPSLSAFASRPRRFAVSRTYLVIFSSCLEPRGIPAISAKYFHTSAGFRPSIALDIGALLTRWDVRCRPRVCAAGSPGGRNDRDSSFTSLRTNLNARRGAARRRRRRTAPRPAPPISRTSPCRRTGPTRSCPRRRGGPAGRAGRAAARTSAAASRLVNLGTSTVTRSPSRSTQGGGGPAAGRRASGRTRCGRRVPEGGADRRRAPAAVHYITALGGAGSSGRAGVPERDLDQQPADEREDQQAASRS